MEKAGIPQYDLLKILISTYDCGIPLVRGGIVCYFVAFCKINNQLMSKFTRRAWGPGTGEITFLAVSFVFHKYDIEDEMKWVINCEHRSVIQCTGMVVPIFATFVVRVGPVPDGP